MAKTTGCICIHAFTLLEKLKCGHMIMEQATWLTVVTPSPGSVFDSTDLDFD